MKSITIHRLDDDLEARLGELAAQRGLSLNQLIKNLLRERLGLDGFYPLQIRINEPPEPLE